MENENTNATAPTEPTAPAEPVAPAEPTVPTEPATPAENPYNAIIEEQKAQIVALMDANKSLTEQVTNLISSGAQISHTEPMKQTAAQKPVATAGEYAPVYGAGENPLSQLNTPSLADDNDYSLEGLASDIGKR